MSESWSLVRSAAEAPLHATQQGCGGGSSAGPWLLACGHPGCVTVFQELGLNGTEAVLPLLFTQRSVRHLELSFPRPPRPTSLPGRGSWRPPLHPPLRAGWAPGSRRERPALPWPGLGALLLLF